MAWAGSILLAICAFPQVVKTVKEGHCEQLSWLFLLSWFVGEILLVFHSMDIGDVALFFNYSFNSALIVILLHYRISPRAPISRPNR